MVYVFVPCCSRVKECCLSTLCSLCLGQEGPLGLGSACGWQAPYSISSVAATLQTALQGKDDRTHTWHWWAGRLYFFDNIMTRFTVEYLMEHCVIAPATTQTHDSNSEHPVQMTEGDLGEEPVEPAANTLALSSAVKKNLLMQIWYFAAAATHVPHQKLCKLARRVVIRTARVLKDDAQSLEVVRDVIACCNRTQAERLLERVLRDREDPAGSITRENQPHHAETKQPAARKSKSREHPSDSFTGHDHNDSGGSDDSFRSALSHLEDRSSRAAAGMDESSSTSTSHDSKSDDSKPVSQPLFPTDVR